MGTLVITSLSGTPVMLSSNTMQGLVMVTLVFLVLATKSDASRSKQRKEAGIQGRKFLFSYPSNTFPLSNRQNNIFRRKAAVDSDTRRGEVEDTGEEVEDTTEKLMETTKITGITEITAEDVETTTTAMSTSLLEIDDKDNLISYGNKNEDNIFNNYQVNEENTVNYEPRNDKSFLNSFPFHHYGHGNGHGRGHTKAQKLRKHHNVDGINVDDRRVTNIDRATPDIIDDLSEAVPDASGRRCVDKVMMREETEYDEVLTCDHSYDRRCHTSYVTKYEPHQEQECDEKFRKVCTIDYEQKALHEVVEVCITPFVKDCEIEGEEVCQTVYESECSTVQIVHQVEDDVANCKTEEETKCEEVTEGFTTVEKCDTWPVEKCSLEKKLVKKYTPHTSCQKVPKEMCAPKDCGIKEGPVQCQDKVKTVVVDNPIEECDMEPLRTCKHVTKLVPKLEPSQECVDVPKEICARSKVNPRRVKKPSIQKWCFTPKNDTGCNEDSQCNGVHICVNRACIVGCRTEEDCQSDQSCAQYKCIPKAGKVLLESFTIHTLSCTGCSGEKEGVKLNLVGERSGEFPSGYTCSSSDLVPLNHKNSDDFFSGGLATFDGSTAAERNMMGDCIRAPLNAMVRGGNVTWVGEGNWAPGNICVDWNFSNFAYVCELKKVASRENVWEISNCSDKDDIEKCP